MDFNKIQVLVEKFDYLLLRVNELQKKKFAVMEVEELINQTI